MRFHVPGLAHTVSHPDYTACAFTQKVVKLCKMLTDEGHTVFHYGHEDSQVECFEHIPVTGDRDLRCAYGAWDWKTMGFPEFSQGDIAHTVFYARTPQEIKRRYEPGDMLLCSFGDFHRPLAAVLPHIPAIESGIGYPNGAFSKYRVFESYAVMHAYQGNIRAVQSGENHWYDAVIPNAFDVSLFPFQNTKEDYFAFVGRLGSHKGLHIAKDIAERTETKLIVAGAGTQMDKSKWVEYVGIVGAEDRAKLLGGAKATICASTYLEPFCGVQIESMLCGTPVISSDWGAFAEYNIHGQTGYRCRTMEQFVFAARNVDKLGHVACRNWGEEFSLEKIAPRYTDYLQSVKDVCTGAGFYEPRPERATLTHSSNVAF